MMHQKKLILGILLIVSGYVLGLAQQAWIESAQAQEDSGVAAETILKVRSAYSTLFDARKDLIAEGRHEVSLRVVNTLAVGAGGTESLKDLERGTGVDPFTYGALYAGFAEPAIASEISLDDSGRLMYRNKVVRLYSPERMKQLYKDFERYAAGN
ncbi:MAG: hypothetical protein R3C11_03455 [Planctomycetaceae bacterium]